MKNLVRIGLLTAMLSIPAYAFAADNTAHAKMAGMNCPMHGEMGTMKKDMGDMMSDMEGMMKDMNDPAMKKHMQEMHDKMGAMMAHMDKMHEGMDKMMDKKGDAVKSDTAPAMTPEEHKAHHP